MSYFVVDVESDGPVPGLYSMVSLGIVRLDDDLKITFFGQCRPISDSWQPEALAISGISRETHLMYEDPKAVMTRMALWVESVNKNGRPILVSDNNQFDGMFIAYYTERYLGKNPFGFSSRRIGDLYCGLVKDTRSKWKHLRKTPHTHNPVDDAKGNAEALLEMRKMGLRLDF